MTQVNGQCRGSCLFQVWKTCSGSPGRGWETGACEGASVVQPLEAAELTLGKQAAPADTPPTPGQKW